LKKGYDKTPAQGMTYEEIARALGRRNKRAAGCVYVECRIAIRRLWRGRRGTFHDFTGLGIDRAGG
jgi:hypothetical protein